MRSSATLLCISALLPLLVNCQSVQTPDPREWGTPERLSNPAEAIRPHVAVDPNGNAVAVWDEGNPPEEAREDIWSNRYVPGVGWGAAELIEINDTGPATFARVAMDGDGNALTVWHQSSGASDRTRLDIWANSYAATTDNWGSAELIETEDEGSARRPEVAMDLAGNALAVWYQFDGEYENIWSNRYAHGAGWGDAELIETNEGDALWPQVAMDLDGNAIAVWQQCYAGCDSADGMRSNIWSNRYTAASGTWGTHRPITPDSTGDSTRPDVAVDANGNAVAVWQQSDATGGRLDIWASRDTPATAGWGAPELIEFNDADHGLRPQVAMDPQGNAVAVWFQFGGTTEDIWSNSSTAGGVWGTAERIEANDAGEAVFPKVAMDASGNAVVVWTQLDGSHDSIWSNLFTPSFGWRRAEPIEDHHGGRAQQPEVAMAPDGVAVAVWTQRVRGSDEIWSNRLEWPDSQ